MIIIVNPSVDTALFYISTLSSSVIVLRVYIFGFEFIVASIAINWFLWIHKLFLLTLILR